MATETTSPRPLRRDAARNRARILAAAGELFTQRGLGVTLNDVAHHAGVGVGTVYRHFPNKTELIDTLFHERVDDLVALGEAALADPDPWHGFVSLMRSVLELQASDRGLHELVHDSPEGMERVVHIRSRMLPIGTELILRAQAAGAVRPDIDVTDTALSQLMVGAVLDAARGVAPDAWRRSLQIVLRGMATCPDELEPFDAPPLTVEQVDVLMTNYKSRRR